jgi:hypothetical protein
MHFRRRLALLSVALPLLAGCGESSTATSVTSAPPATSAQPSPAVKAHPSAKATMVCADEAQEDIGKAIGVETAKQVTATWADDLYSCPYVYTHGTMTLSVKELADPTNAIGAYFNELQHDLGWNKKVPLAFGDGAFVTTNGSVVVRKDNLVLLVDVRELPDQFGQPPTARSATAQAVAKTIMGCWR